MPTSAAPELLQVVGFLTGAVLYAMLLAMAARTAASGDRLTIVTGLLGLGWNVGQLLASAWRGLLLPGAERWTAAGSYAALGFLAAVVVHSVSRGTAGRDPRPAAHWIAWLAYACAGIAGALHLSAAAGGLTLPSATALTFQTIGLLALAPALILSTRGQAIDRRALWMTALAIFSVSAVHLSRFHGADESWTVELLGHQASVPLAFAILYEDYRFALADLFLKQALALIALVAVVFSVWSLLAPSFAGIAPSPTAVGGLLASWVVTALLFPWIRNGVTAFVDRVVLGRTDYASLTEAVVGAVQRSDNEQAVLDRVCDLLGPALSATAVWWQQLDGALAPRPVQHELPIPTADAPFVVLRIGELAGGRRLLSDDLAMLERAVLVAARRIDVLRLTEERYERALREREMQTLATESELRALRAQINPHFLFNALTTIGYLIESAPDRAVDTLLRLTTLLRSVLKSEGSFTTLGREQELIDNYLQIEAARFEERLRVTIDIPAELRDISIPSLIVQPLVENAIKHGIARSREGGVVTVSARLTPSGVHSVLAIDVRNTGAPLTATDPSAGTGVGLQNVERRLRHYYGEHTRVTLRVDEAGSTVAEIRVPAGGLNEVPVPVSSRHATW